MLHCTQPEKASRILRDVNPVGQWSRRRVTDVVPVFIIQTRLDPVANIQERSRFEPRFIRAVNGERLADSGICQ